MPTATPISRVNDFVVRFANVNGSGSASANEMFARAVMRMGIPVAPRNIFPSNIQGLPTWYEVRISEAGHLGARGGTDLMVAMNPQTFDRDIAGIEPGGYLFYDSTKPMPASKFRDDITVIGVPLTAICNREYTDPRQRQLFKNIIYIGVLTALLDMDVKVVEQLIGEQYKGKDKLIEPNIKALHIGLDQLVFAFVLLANELLDDLHIHVKEGGEYADIDDVLEQLTSRGRVYSRLDGCERHANDRDVITEFRRRHRLGQIVEQITAWLDAGDTHIKGLRVHRHGPFRRERRVSTKPVQKWAKPLNG